LNKFFAICLYWPWNTCIADINPFLAKLSIFQRINTVAEELEGSTPLIPKPSLYWTWSSASSIHFPSSQFCHTQPTVTT
jgi:hypothetical protein